MESAVQQIPGQVMAVNSFLVHGPEGVVVVDGMLTVSDAQLVRAAVDRSGASLAGVLVTHEPSTLAYNGMHAYQADGRWAEWLTSLGTFEARLDDDATLHVGHGASGTKALLASQRRYIEGFVAALDANLDAITAGDHDPVLAAMKEVLPTDGLLFLLDLSIDPVHSAWACR